MTSKKRILVASTPDGQYIAQHALIAEYDLQFVSTLREAKELLQENPCPYHMVIAGIHFDDSRMFELLEFVRSIERLSSLPFLVIQAKPSLVPFTDAVRMTAQKLGACGFLELHTLPAKKAQSLLREWVEKCPE